MTGKFVSMKDKLQRLQNSNKLIIYIQKEEKVKLVRLQFSHLRCLADRSINEYKSAVVFRLRN